MIEQPQKSSANDDYSDYTYKISPSEENWFEKIEIVDKKFKKRNVFPQCPAKALMEAYKFKTLPSKDLYRFNKEQNKDAGIWQLDGEIIVNLECDHMFSPTVGATKSRKKAVISYIKDHTIIRGKHVPQPPEHLIPLQDKLLDTTTWKFVPYSHRYFFTGKIDVYVDLNAECPNFMKFLEEASKPEDIRLLQEWTGYCMLPNYRFKKALVILGPPNTGKTTYFNVLGALLGKENFSSVGLKNLVENIFAPDQLHGKLANIDADLMETKEAITTISMFKKLTGKDSIDAQRKHTDLYKFTNYAKLSFGANKLPPITKADNAYYDRWMIINFDNIVPRAKRDAFLIEKLTTDEELRGILKWALIGLKRLMERGHFDYKLTAEEVKALYLRNTSTIIAFLQDEVEIAPTEFITKQELFHHYNKYCFERKIPTETITKFGILIRQNCAVLPFRPRLEDGSRREAWKGLTIRDVRATKSAVLPIK